MSYIQTLVNIILVAALYFPLFMPLVNEWENNEFYSHGFLIPVLSIYFLWQKKNELKNTHVQPEGAGLFFILAGVILYMLAKMGYQFFTQCFSMLIVLFGLVYAQMGREMIKKTFFPIFYLVFMIPLPGLVLTTMTFHLRLFSTKLAFFAIKLLGINATREGNIIHLPTAVLVVANPCSGLRSLITFSAASLAIGYLFQKSMMKRIILFASSILLAVLMNMARLVSTAVIVNAFKIEGISSKMDTNIGLVVLVVGCAALFAINAALEKIK